MQSKQSQFPCPDEWIDFAKYHARKRLQDKAVLMSILLLHMYNLLLQYKAMHVNSYNNLYYVTKLIQRDLLSHLL